MVLYRPHPCSARSNSSEVRLFSDDAWLQGVRSYGAALGLGVYAARIFATRSGQVYVPIPAERRAILALRHQPNLEASLAHQIAANNAVVLSTVLGEPATAGDLALAHYIGAEAAVRLLESAEREPQQPASEIAPAAALGHPSLFFQGRRPRSVEALRRSVREAIARALAAAGHAMAARISSSAHQVKQVGASIAVQRVARPVHD